MLFLFFGRIQNGAGANNFIFDIFWRYAATVEFDFAENLNPDKCGESWVVIDPAADSEYKGLLSATSEIKPARIGARWAPRPFNQSTDQKCRVVIHFHAGGYVANGKDKHVAWGSDTLADHLIDGFVLAVQYRLASDKKSRFPAQLQDGFTVYKYVLSLGVSASEITFSGGSAGANLSITLLRYLTEQNDPKVFPIPRAVFLWSPWLDLTTSSTALNTHRNRSTDFMSGEFIGWAYKAYLPKDLPRENAYISPLFAPFSTEASVYIMTGDAEIIHDDALNFEREMKAIEGNRVELDIIPYAMHDVFSCASIMEFEDQAVASMKKAISFAYGRDALR